MSQKVYELYMFYEQEFGDNELEIADREMSQEQPLEQPLEQPVKNLNGLPHFTI
jgi:hypothetical protein